MLFNKGWVNLTSQIEMNKDLKVLDILTNKNFIEDILKKHYLEEEHEDCELKLAVLFRRYYGVYNEDFNEKLLPPSQIIKNIIQFKRLERFTQNKYWSIWREEGLFFGFIEGFFHAQEGKNQLCKIKGRKIEEDFLLPNFRKLEIKKKFKIVDQIDYFKSPESFVFRFQDLEEFRIYLRVNKIDRMVARRENILKGMHFNIYKSVLEISKNEDLKQIFEGGLINPETGKIDKKFFDSEVALTQNGLYAVLSSFMGYGPKIAKMVMNLVFDVPIIAVDRRVLRSALMLSMFNLNAFYYDKIISKFNMQNCNKKQLIDKVSSLSERSILMKAENKLNTMFKNSYFLAEVDYLLFTYNGGEGWNLEYSKEENLCRVGRCCFDEFGTCMLRKKVEFKDNAEEKTTIKTFRYN